MFSVIFNKTAIVKAKLVKNNLKLKFIILLLFVIYSKLYIFVIDNIHNYVLKMRSNKHRQFPQSIKVQAVFSSLS